MGRKPRQAASCLRLELRTISRQMDELLSEILRRDPLVKGTVYQRRRRCGRAGCHCQQGQGHISEAFSYSEEGRTRHLSLEEVDVDSLRRHVENYRRFRKARASLCQKWGALLKAVDAMESLRRIPVAHLRQAAPKGAQG